MGLEVAEIDLIKHGGPTPRIAIGGTRQRPDAQHLRATLYDRPGKGKATTVAPVFIRKGPPVRHRYAPGRHNPRPVAHQHLLGPHAVSWINARSRLGFSWVYIQRCELNTTRARPKIQVRRKDFTRPLNLGRVARWKSGSTRSMGTHAKGLAPRRTRMAGTWPCMS